MNLIWFIYIEFFIICKEDEFYEWLGLELVYLVDCDFWLWSVNFYVLLWCWVIY